MNPNSNILRGGGDRGRGFMTPEKRCFQRGFEFFKNISFIKKMWKEHQKLKSVNKI